MNKIKKLIGGNMRQYGMLIALALIVLLFQITTKGILLKPLNINNLIQQNSYVLILAIGMLPVILTGNVDLSVGSILGLTGAIAAELIINRHAPVLPTMLLAVLLGGCMGAFQGFWIAYVNIPPFIVTLGGQLMFRGLTMALLKGLTLAPFPDSFKTISASWIPDPFGGMPNFIAGKGSLHVLTLIVGVAACVLFVMSTLNARRKAQKYGQASESFVAMILRCVIVCVAVLFATYQLAVYRGVPWVLVLLAILVIIYTFITENTIMGRNVYAFGGNAKAARLAGINTRKTFFLAYVNMGLLAGLAGVVFSGRINSAAPSSGDGFELDAIASCYIGGASASGGIGKISGAIIGGLIMGVLNNGMSIMGIGIDIQMVIKGLVLILAVALDVVSKTKAVKA